MSRHKRIAASLLSGILLGALLPPSSVSAADNTCWKYKRSERRFARKINGERGDLNLRKLSLDPEVSKAARVHTRAMVNRNELYHTPSDKLRKRVTNWVVLGENVGVGGTVRSLHNAFMNSPAHRDNVLYSTFKYVGVGVKKSGGRMWVTIIFEAESNPGTPLRMPKC